MAYITKKTTQYGVKPIGSNLFGLCSTASSSSQKSVTMPDFNVLVSGVTIHVYFVYGNTAQNPTLAVGSTQGVPILRNGTNSGKWSSGSVISFTYDGTNWIQNDADDGSESITYGLALNGNQLSLVEGGQSSSVTLTDNDTTYSLSISGNVLTLTDSDGNHDDVTLPSNSDTTYTISISGHTLTLTPSSGSPQTITLPDDNTTYTAGTGLSLNGTQFSVKTGYTTSGNNRKVQTDANGNLYVIQKDDDTNNRRGFYGTCSTAAATSAKVITLSNTAGWELIAGTIITVKFTATNTAQNPTFNVNGSGAKSVWYNTSVITTGSLGRAGYANRPQMYVYDGTYWVWMGASVEDNTWQSNTNSRAGTVASGANQNTKVWKTDANGNPAWRDEHKYPAYSASGTAGTGTIDLANGVITQIPLTRTLIDHRGNVGSDLGIDSNNGIAIEGTAGVYRVVASVYIRPTANAMIGVYIKQGTSNFANATEKSSALSYATTTGGAINVTQIVQTSGSSREYIYLGARVYGSTGKAYIGNAATYLEVQQIG